MAAKIAFSPISPNPFIVGNPIRGQSMFFGRENEFELVRRRFTETEARGGLLVFCGERRSGKTSILFQIMEGRLGSGFMPVLIDMQSMAVDSEQAFLRKICENVAAVSESLGNPLPALQFQPDETPAAAFHSFINLTLARNPGKKLILLFDEYELFEDRIESGALSPDSIYILSNLMETSSVFLIFTGSLRLEERHNEYWKVFLGKSIYRHISFLERKDAILLITKPLEGRADFEHGVVDSVLNLTGGHPFYTQAICQSIVDVLNEREVSLITQEILEEVTDHLIRNPLPQMLFSWDGLAQEQRYTLSLLAEKQPGASAYTTNGELFVHIQKNRYPYRLSSEQILSALEGMIRMGLLVHDNLRPPGFAFRMDLWRQWIRRNYPVWQVIQHSTIKSTPSGRNKSPAIVVIGSLLAVLLIGSSWWFLTRHPEREISRPPGSSGTLLSVEASPQQALITVDGLPPVSGSFSGNLRFGTHRIHISCPGHADSTFSVSMADSTPVRLAVRLRSLTGAVFITTSPANAEIWIDGIRRGQSPRNVTNLSLLEDHALELRLPGQPPIRKSFRLDSEDPLRLPVFVFSSPARESSPAAPEPEKQGILELKGDSLAIMTIDERVVRGDFTYNSGPQPVSPGSHRIRIRTRSGREFQGTVQVGPDEHVIYDYIQQRIVSSRPRSGE